MTLSPGRPRRHRGPAALACLACAQTITAARHRCRIEGAHEHRCTNPAGVAYHVGCFREAIGCVVVGPDSVEQPWFGGFTWRRAFCAGCRAHLGWNFRSPTRASFFALVLDRLRAADRP
jgi:hypothetical protein